MKVIILAGGNGTRLWPLSRERYPKQFIKIQGRKESLFQETFRRSAQLVGIEDIYIVTNERYKFILTGELEEIGYTIDDKNILIEPEAKNTLPAIYAGVNEITKISHETVVVFPSDQIIEDNNKIITVIKESKLISEESIVIFGIKPSNPNTGFGYISFGEKNLNGYKVKAFIEKPNQQKAEEYLKKGYYWNSGMFMFNTKVFCEEVKKYSPDVADAFQNSRDIDEAFSKIKYKVSIDYGIIEKSKKVSVIPVDVGWNDLGSFDSFYDVLQKGKSGNICDDQNIIIDSSNNLIQSYARKTIAVIGVEDLIIIDNRDALLVCQKDQSQKVRNVVDVLKARNDSSTDYNLQDFRPWGNYRIIEEEKNTYKIKKITVEPGKRISYQLHHHRSEHWIVVRGMAKVTVDEENIFVRSGESVFFKEGQKHRLENPGKIPLEIIEVQMGQYLEEDDIVRFDYDLENVPETVL